MNIQSRRDGKAKFRFRCSDHCVGSFFIGGALHVLVLFLIPMVAVGQEPVPQVQIKTAADHFPQSRSATLERVEISVALIRVSEDLEGSDPRLWNVDMGGVNLFRLPEAPMHYVNTFSPAALIGPVWNHGITGPPNEANGFGKQLWNWQGTAHSAQNSITILEGNSKDIEISIGEQPSSDVTVVITGHAGTDLSVSPSTLTFTASDWADQTATLTAGDDDDAINDELTLTITTTQGSNESSVQRVITIVDDEIIWELTPRVILESTISNTSIPLLETLGPPSGDVTFTITGHEGTSLAPRPTTLTFPTDDWQRSQELDLFAKLDEDDTDERVTLAFTAEGGGYDGLTYSMEVTIEDRPPYEESIPEGGSVSFAFVLGANLPTAPQRDLIATYSGHEGTDLTVSPSTVIHRADSWIYLCLHGVRLWLYCSVGEYVEVTAGHDPDDVDDQETLIYSITGPADEPVWLGISAQTNVRIEDDDDPGLEVSPSSLDVPEEEKRSFSVRLSGAPLGDIGNTDVTVSIPPSQGDLTASPLSLTFTKENWYQWQGVELTAGHDADIADDMEEFTVTASGGGFDGERGSVSVRILDNEEPGLRIYPIRVSVNEGGDWVTVRAVLTAQPTGEVTVVVPPFTDPALQHNRLRSPMTFTRSNYRRGQAVTVWAEEDADAVNEFESVTLRASGGGYDGVTRLLRVSVTDNDVVGGRLEVDPTSVLVNEGLTAAFTVKLSAEPEGAVTVTIPSFAEPALSQNSPRLTFTPSNYSTAQTVTISAAEDANAEDEFESITLRASGGGYSGAAQTVRVTVIDNDASGIELIPSSLSVTEGTAETYSVWLLSEPAEAVTITIVESGGGVTASPLMLHFTASDWDESQQVSVRADSDANSINETSTLIHTATSADPGYSGTTAILSVTVIDQDAPRLEVSPGALTMDEGSSAEFTVKLSSEPTAGVTVQIPTFTNPDLTHNQSALSFTPSTWDAPQTVTVSAMEDADAEDEVVETLTLRASGGEYSGITGTVTVTVEDNDQRGILLNPLSLELEEGGAAGTYTVALQSAPTSDVTVAITGPSAKVTLDRESLTFTPSTWDDAQTITVQALEDQDTDDEQFMLTHRARGGGYDHETADLEVRIKDKGEVALSIYDAQVDEGAGSVDLRVELNQPTGRLVSVMYRAVAEDAAAGSDYEDSRGIVLFGPGSTKGRIRLDILEDELPELDETFTVVLSSARHAVIARETGRVTILDNDAVSAVWIDDGVAFEEDGVVRFAVHLSEPSEAPVTVSYRTENGTAMAGEDYAAASGLVTFAPGEVETEISVELLRDELDWRQETFTVHLQSSGKTRIEKAVAVATIREETSVRSGVLKAYTARFVRTSAVQIVGALHQRFRSRRGASSCSAPQRAVMAQVWGALTGGDPSLGELLAGCHISRDLGGLSVWGRGSFTRFNGRGADALRLRADVTTAMVGTDYRWRQRWLVGLLVSHSQADGTFRLYEESGAVQSGLTGVVPYVSVQGEDWGAWMAMGYGRGRTEVQELEGDLTSTFGAAGVQGEWASTAWFGLNVHGDVLVAGAEVDVHAVSAQVYRVRAGLGGDLRVSDMIRPYVEVNVRQDGGSAETGTGLELGGGIRLSYPAWRLKGEMRTQGLVIHSADGFTEWGLSGLVQVGEGPKGLVVSVRPSWGPHQGGVLQRQQTILEAVPAGANLHQIKMEMAYGVPLKAGVMRSVAGMTQLFTGRMYRLGTELRPRDYMSVSVFGMAYAHANAPIGIGLNLQGSVRY